MGSYYDNLLNSEVDFITLHVCQHPNYYQPETMMRDIVAVL